MIVSVLIMLAYKWQIVLESDQSPKGISQYMFKTIVKLNKFHDKREKLALYFL